MPLIKAMHPDEKHTITVDPSVFHEEAAAQEVGKNTFAEKMEKVSSLLHFALDC